MSETNLPYVISAELEYASEDTIRTAGISSFRSNLENSLASMGKKVEWVEASALKHGLQRLYVSTSLPVVSMDGRYLTQADASLGLSRAVTSRLEEAGYDARLGELPLAAQFNAIGQRFAGQEVVVADDVIFSGEMLAWVQRQLAMREVSVSAVMAGISIGEGAMKLAARGIEVQSVTTFDQGVEDEICERDFSLLAGTGRKVKGCQQSALYFDPECGKPEQWASIASEEAADFCLASLEMNMRLMQPDAPTTSLLGYPVGTHRAVLTQVIAQKERKL